MHDDCPNYLYSLFDSSTFFLLFKVLPWSLFTDPLQCNSDTAVVWLSYSALIWQKEASDKSDISRKRAKCVCHLDWRQWNIMMSYLTYLLVGWVFLHEIWPGRRAQYVNYENINNSNLDGMSLASFCQSLTDLTWFCSCLQLAPILVRQGFAFLWQVAYYL